MNLRIAGIAIAVVVVAGGLAAWVLTDRDSLPEGIAVANGRIEAERIDVATKFAGRIAEILADEGDFVTSNSLLARLDDSEIQAQLREAKAAVEENGRQIEIAKALLAQRKSEKDFAEKELHRSQTLSRRDFATQELVDERRSQLLAAEASVLAAEAEIARATAAEDGAKARVDRLESNLEDYSMLAPRSGRVQYRLASVGEVLASGDRVLTLLDLTDVYMTVFLPTAEAGRLALGDEARIVLDAAPDYVIPAYISFVASEAQFTPKYVETAEERQKLMFRVKVKIAPDLLLKYQRVVKTGVPGLAYLRLSPDVPWPPELTPRLPEPLPPLSSDG